MLRMSWVSYLTQSQALGGLQAAPAWLSVGLQVNTPGEFTLPCPLFVPVISLCLLAHPHHALTVTLLLLAECSQSCAGALRR